MGRLSGVGRFGRFYPSVCPLHLSHVHAYHGENVAVFSISPIGLIVGFLSVRQQPSVAVCTELAGLTISKAKTASAPFNKTVYFNPAERFQLKLAPPQQ